MNHYERLKVSPEAPPEVIRAAYRALAAKLHPDRKGGDAGPSEHAHEEMAALNASYLVLMDEQARADYDRTLKGPAHATPDFEADRAAATRSAWGRQRASAQASPPPEAAAASAKGPETRIDIDWLLAMPGSPPAWYRNPRWIAAALVAGGLVVASFVWWGLQEAERLEFDRSLAHRGALSPAVAPQMPVAERVAPEVATAAPAPAAVAAASGASAPEITPEQLSRMSDAELLAAMPRLLNDSGVTAPAVPHPTLMAPSGGAHPLDGQPLGLKSAPLNLPSLKISQP